MGVCKYCRELTSLKESEHIECRRRREDGIREIVNLIYQLANDTVDYKDSVIDIGNVATSSFIDPNDLSILKEYCWDQMIRETLLFRHKLRNDHKVLLKLARRLDIPQTTIDESFNLKLLSQVLTIQDIIEGKIPRWDVSREDYTFNLQKSETLVWAFRDTQYLKEVVVQRRYQSGWRSIPTQYGTESVDRGTMGVTDKHIYFVGNKEHFRIRYDNIVSLKEYPDGIGLTRGAEKARQQKFVTGEEWFTYNLVNKLAKLY